MEKPKILGLDHIQIMVKDLEEMVTFYKLLGFEVERRTEHHGGAAELRVPNGPIIEFHVAESPENIEYVNHIAYTVDDIEETYQYLSSKGIKFSMPPRFSWLPLMNLLPEDNPLRKNKKI